MMKQNGQNTQVETDTLVEEVVMQAETPEADIAIVFEEEAVETTERAATEEVVAEDAGGEP
ncbi:MAG TPA: hypothetical protein G4N94_14470, partial [Caldilineae bacterium]|nr:hypothetical protein [Caldilineae bacterium]